MSNILTPLDSSVYNDLTYRPITNELLPWNGKDEGLTAIVAKTALSFFKAIAACIETFINFLRYDVLRFQSPLAKRSIQLNNRLSNKLNNLNILKIPFDFSQRDVAATLKILVLGNKLSVDHCREIDRILSLINNKLEKEEIENFDLKGKVKELLADPEVFKRFLNYPLFFQFKMSSLNNAVKDLDKESVVSTLDKGFTEMRKDSLLLLPSDPSSIRGDFKFEKKLKGILGAVKRDQKTVKHDLEKDYPRMTWILNGDTLSREIDLTEAQDKKRYKKKMDAYLKEQILPSLGISDEKNEKYLMILDNLHQGAFSSFHELAMILANRENIHLSQYVKNNSEPITDIKDENNTSSNPKDKTIKATFTEDEQKIEGEIYFQMLPCQETVLIEDRMLQINFTFDFKNNKTEFSIKSFKPNSEQ